MTRYPLYGAGITFAPDRLMNAFPAFYADGKFCLAENANWSLEDPDSYNVVPRDLLDEATVKLESASELFIEPGQILAVVGDEFWRVAHTLDCANPLAGIEWMSIQLGHRVRQMSTDEYHCLQTTLSQLAIENFDATINGESLSKLQDAELLLCGTAGVKFAELLVRRLATQVYRLETLRAMGTIVTGLTEQVINQRTAEYLKVHDWHRLHNTPTSP